MGDYHSVPNPAYKLAIAYKLAWTTDRFDETVGLRYNAKDNCMIFC